MILYASYIEISESFISWQVLSQYDNKLTKTSTIIIQNLCVCVEGVSELEC